MAYKVIDLAVPSADGTSAPVDVSGLSDLHVLVGSSGGFTATIAVQVSLDGVVFAPAGSTTDANARFAVAGRVDKVRAVVSGYMAGTLAGSVAGNNPRAD